MNVKIKSCIAILAGLLFSGMITTITFAHGEGPWGMQTIDWKNDYIREVITFPGGGRRVTVAGKNCLAGGEFWFNVRDEYAFDINETVWLDVELHDESRGAKVS